MRVATTILSAVLLAPWLVSAAEASGCRGSYCNGGGPAPRPNPQNFSTQQSQSQESTASSNAQGAAVNEQTTSSQTTAIGGDNVNNSYYGEFGKTSTFQFSEKGVSCEGPRLSIGVWGDPGDSYYEWGYRKQANHDIRGAVALSIPLGGERVICQAIAKRIEQRIAFDTEKGILGACTAMAAAGTRFTPELLAALPNLAICVDIVAAAATPQALQVPQPQPLVAPPQPQGQTIRGLW